MFTGRVTHLRLRDLLLQFFLDDPCSGLLVNIGFFFLGIIGLIEIERRRVRHGVIEVQFQFDGMVMATAKCLRS